MIIFANQLILDSNNPTTIISQLTSLCLTIRINNIEINILKYQYCIYKFKKTFLNFKKLVLFTLQKTLLISMYIYISDIADIFL